MDTKQPEALRLADALEAGRILPTDAGFPLHDAAAELRRLHARIAELETRLEVDAHHPYDGIACRDATIAELQAGYDAARLEIASLREHVQQLGKLARDVNSRRVVELESQLEAMADKLRAGTYDQQALELCEACGWKTLVPGDCCVNCRRNELERMLDAVGAGGVEPLRKQGCLQQISEPEMLSLEQFKNALVMSRVVDADAVDNSDAYDDGVMLGRIYAAYRRCGGKQ